MKPSHGEQLPSLDVRAERAARVQHCIVVSPWCLLGLSCWPSAPKRVIFWGGGGVFSSSNRMKSHKGCVTACRKVFLARLPRARVVDLFNGLKMQSVSWSQTRCSLIRAASQSGTWHGLSPKGTKTLFWRKRPGLLWKQARRARMFVWIVGGWNLRPTGTEKSGRAGYP